jgi:hypothetical protein
LKGDKLAKTKKGKKKKKVTKQSKSKGKKKKKKKKKKLKLSNYFVIGSALRGTEPAIIRTTSLKKAYVFYVTKVHIPAHDFKTNTTPADRFDPDSIVKKGRIYWDGDVYVEKLTRYKKFKKTPVAIPSVNLSIESRDYEPGSY